MTLLFIFVVCGILESVLMATGKPYWFILSTGGDSITAVMTDMSRMFESLGIDASRFGAMLENYQPMDISLAATGMVIYLVVGFVVSLWVSNRRQLA
jgi:hypothetical protein